MNLHIILLTSLFCFVTSIDSYYIYTIAGTGATGSTGDGSAATSCSLNSPESVSLDSSNNVYIADASNNKIRKIDSSTGKITTIVGTGTATYSGDNGYATSATINYPMHTQSDSSGNIYITDTGNCRIRKLTVSTGIINTIIGTGSCGYSGDTGYATSASINYPHGFSLLRSGSTSYYFLADTSNNRIRKVITSTGIITTIVGTGTGSYSGDDGQATSATIYGPEEICFDNSGSTSVFYFADRYNNRIRYLKSDGKIKTYAGNGLSSYSSSQENGDATSASINGPESCVFDNDNSMYVADNGNHRIYKISGTTGKIYTIAGTGTTSSSVNDNGPATSSHLYYPGHLAIDSSYNVYISDYGNQRIRILTASPSYAPTRGPTRVPTILPSRVPTFKPTFTPTVVPSRVPTFTPTFTPTVVPSRVPTFTPTVTPTVVPTYTPTVTPTFTPTVVPSGVPTTTPTVTPTVVPSRVPSVTPTFTPTIIPTVTPSVTPTFTPTIIPTLTPSVTPTYTPTIVPTVVPSRVPTTTPTITPTLAPTVAPTTTPSVTPTFTPSEIPSETPTFIPSEIPTETPTFIPSEMPSLPLSSSPTSHPTSIPTFKPTITNLVLINTLNVIIDKKLVADKAQYYLGYYIGYFLILFIVLLIIDKSKFGKKYIDKLLNSAYDSNIYNPNTCKSFENFTTRERDALILKDLFKKDQCLMHTLEEERIKNELDEKSLHKRNETHDINDNSIQDEKNAENSIEFSDKRKTRGGYVKNKFSSAFYQYILQRRAYIGCEPLIYENGYIKNMICFIWCFPKGAYEDFLIYLANNHLLLSCIYAAKGGPLSRSGRRLVYMMQYSLAFFIKIVSFGVLQYFNIPEYVSPAFSILIITPLSISFGTFIKLLYTCSCLVNNNQFRVEHPRMHRWVKSIGKLVTIPFVLLVFGLLVLASTFSCQSSRYDIILSFFLQVQILSSILEVIYAILIFIPDYYYNLSIITPFFSKTLVLIGSLYAERLIKFVSKPGSMKNINERQLFINSKSYFGGFIRSETLCSRAYALKKGWITEIDEENYRSTIEMSDFLENSPFYDNSKDTIEYTTSRTSSFTSMNPMIQFSRIKSVSQISSIVPPRPPPPPPPPILINSKFVEIENDANQLYQSYLKEVSHNDRHSLSFEEWKLNRKKFKENTRRSFIAAYNNIADHIEGRTNDRLREQFFQRTNPLIHHPSSGITTVNDNIDLSDDNTDTQSTVKNMIKRFSVVP